MRLDRERAAAAATDRALWTGQGAKNPHAAAHFGQYAFKPQSPLALADPGVDAYVGEAVWLEAHRQNEAQFRSARDTGVAARLGGLSFAFVLQTIMPLVADPASASPASPASASAARCASSMSLGASPVDILAGKALAALGALSALLVPAFALARARRRSSSPITISPSPISSSVFSRFLSAMASISPASSFSRSPSRLSREVHAHGAGDPARLLARQLFSRAARDDRCRQARRAAADGARIPQRHRRGQEEDLRP